jgi:ribosome-binding factor A
MVDHARARRLGERIKVLVAEALVQDVKDPDLGFVTITDVRVTPDLMHAKIFYTIFGNEAEQLASREILHKNQGRIRGAIGRQLGIRLTPTIELISDQVPEVAGALDALLAEAKRRDLEVERLAETAQPAGEADPYREPSSRVED